MTKTKHNSLNYVRTDCLYDVFHDDVKAESMADPFLVLNLRCVSISNLFNHQLVLPILVLRLAVRLTMQAGEQSRRSLLVQRGYVGELGVGQRVVANAQDALVGKRELRLISLCACGREVAVV